MLTVGITTFKYRFSQYFVPLLNCIKDIGPDIEVVVAINGDHNEPLDENYRNAILTFIAGKKNVIPVMFPNFRGLAKLWNNILIHSTNDYIFLLNDDVSITSNTLFQNIVAILMRNHFHSFKINNSWSHVVLNKWEVDEVGYFDERLLGISEEDSDYEWRYISHYNRPFANFKISGIIKCDDLSYAPKNIKGSYLNKYSLFNYNFIRHEKYQFDEVQGRILGIWSQWSEKFIPVLENLKQYPYENFYHQRKKEL